MTEDQRAPLYLNTRNKPSYIKGVLPVRGNIVQRMQHFEKRLIFRIWYWKVASLSYYVIMPIDDLKAWCFFKA